MVQQTKVNWSVMCHVCGAEGGWSNPSDAIALWSARATPSPAQAAPADGVAEQDARFAIDGAIAYGRMATNEPPVGHWLTEYWHIGQQLAKLGETSIWDNRTPLATPSPGKAEAERDRWQAFWQMAAEIDSVTDRDSEMFMKGWHAAVQQDKQ
jgi:hypothetical protein